MTEIPEHLLKRSQARKSGGDAPAAAASPAVAASASPAVAAPKAEVVPAGPPPAKPDIPVVAAYKARNKIPMWAMVTLSILPLWAFMYVLALQPAPVKASGPLGDGSKAYATNCSGCHGAGGEGVGSAYAFTNGAVLSTFPHIEDQLRWVYLGTKTYQTAGVQIYGDPNRSGGPHVTGASGGQMPGWKGNLTDAEILAAVCHERFDNAGADKAGAYADEYALWCAVDSPIYAALKDGSANFENVHTKFADKKVMEIGAVPKAGSSK